MHYHSLSEANEVVTASMMRGAFLGTNIKSNTLLTVFEEFNDRQEKLIGIDLAQSTFNKYDLTYRRLKEFLEVRCVRATSCFAKWIGTSSWTSRLT